ncbi:hypothetical protein D3C76_1197670 [compost metagenome]
MFLFLQFITHRDTHGMKNLCADNNLRHKYVNTFRNLTAMLMTTGIQEGLVQGKTMPYKLRHITVTWAYEIFFIKSEFTTYHSSFLSGYRSVETKAALTT